MNLADTLPATATRVQHSTAPDVNRTLRDRTDAALTALEDEGPAGVDACLAALEREWDVERALQANAGTIAFAGVTLGATVDRRFLLLPLVVFAFFAQHALQGWCPPLPLLRRLGVRTQGEIERERYAVKAMRGDFDGLPAAGAAPPRERVRAVLRAVDA